MVLIAENQEHWGIDPIRSRRPPNFQSEQAGRGDRLPSPLCSGLWDPDEDGKPLYSVYKSK